MPAAFQLRRHPISPRSRRWLEGQSPPKRIAGTSPHGVSRETALSIPDAIDVSSRGSTIATSSGGRSVATPVGVATTGSPAAAASTTGRPYPSSSEG